MRISRRVRPAELRSFAWTALFFLAVLYSLYFARDFFLPITLAILASFFLAPAVLGLHRLGIPQTLGAALVVTLLLGALFFGISQVADPAAEWLERLPRNLEQLEAKLSKLREPLRGMDEAAEQLDKMTDSNRPENAVEVEVKHPKPSELLLVHGRRWIGAFVVTVALVYFFLASGDTFLTKLVRVLPRLKDKKRAIAIARNIKEHISKYLFTLSMIYSGLGIAVGMAAFLWGMPNPVLWGALAAVLNFVPYLGAAVGIFIIGVSALLTFGPTIRALGVPATYLLIAVLEGNFITPWILGRRLTLNPVMVFVSLMLWGWIWGIPGLLLAIPILASLKIICEQVEALSPIAEFLDH